MKMRKLLFLVPLFMLMLMGMPMMAQVVGVGVNEQAQTTKERAEAASKAAIEKMIKFGQNRNYESLGRMSVYAGREPNRALKSKVNLLDSYEKLENENTCNLLHKILEQTVIWNTTNFRMVNSVNEKFYYWDIEFTDDKMKTKVYSVLFVELSGEMLFARLEKKGTMKP
jgi:uncharacterized membrane protein YfhO